MSPEPIWKEDVEKELEYIREGCRTLYGFAEQAAAHGAPPEVVQGLYNAYASQYAAWQHLNGVLPCFYPEPKMSET